MAKKINVGNGYELTFDQRARGEETPYYQGRIFKDGVHVGHFSNSGTGGPTTVGGTVGGSSVKADFKKMVRDEANRQGFTGKLLGEFESEGLIVEFAEILGYRKYAKGVKPEEVFPIFMAQVIKDTKDFEKSVGRKVK